jgi:hypothetical protein
MADAGSKPAQGISGLDMVTVRDEEIIREMMRGVLPPQGMAGLWWLCPAMRVPFSDAIFHQENPR